MKTIFKLLVVLSLTLLLVIALPKPVFAATTSAQVENQLFNDRIVFGDTYTLTSGSTQNGSLTIFGGVVSLETGSTVTGDVVILGGTLNANGEIQGNLNSLGGSLFLGDSAVVDGDLSMLGGSLHQADGAQVMGEVVNGGVGSVNVSVPTLNSGSTFFSNLVSTLKPLFNFLGTLVNSLILAALAMLVVLIWPQPSDRIAQSIAAQPLIAGGLGLLTIIVLPALLILIIITIILIPVTILGFLLLGIATLFGWIAVGLEVGKRIVQLFKQEWHPAVTAGLGTLVITLLASFIGTIPCIGWIVSFLITIIGLGAVILTRGGTQVYPSRPITVSEHPIKNEPTLIEPPTVE
jgi:hypothetical protein